MATFTWVPTYGSTLTSKPLTVEIDNGTENETSMVLKTKTRQWRLEFINRPNALANAIDAFLAARCAVVGGVVESFDWTPLYGAPGKWICREWTASPTSPNHRTVSCTFEEVKEPG